MCQAFEFKHFPMSGGLFNQNPQMLERFLYIMGEQEAQRKKEEAAKSRNQGGPKNPKIRGSRPAN